MSLNILKDSSILTENIVIDINLNKKEQTLIEPLGEQ